MSKEDVLENLRQINATISQLEQNKQLLTQELEKQVPVEIFATKLSPAEAVIKFLKENRKFTYHEIALELNRDERGIWGGYQRAHKKLSDSFFIKKSAITIPISIFKNRKLSILENLVMFLKSKNLKLVLISRILNKRSTTISTAYSRAKRKLSMKSTKLKGGEKKV